MGMQDTTPRGGNPPTSEVCVAIGLTAAHLKNMREAAGVSQRVLAKALTMSRQQIDALENGRKVITEDIELAWRKAIRRIALYRAVRVDAVPPGLGDPAIGDASEIENWLSEDSQK